KPLHTRFAEHRQRARVAGTIFAPPGKLEGRGGIPTSTEDRLPGTFPCSLVPVARWTQKPVSLRGSRVLAVTESLPTPAALRGSLHGIHSRGLQDLLPTGRFQGAAEHPVQAVEVRDPLQLRLHGLLRRADPLFTRDENVLPRSFLLSLVQDHQV